MIDFLDRPVREHDSIVFIVNKRGEKPRMMLGTIRRINVKSIEADAVDGERYRIVFSSRSYKDEKLVNTVVLGAPPSRESAVIDYTGIPIILGDRAIFMERPSQGFCTSFQLGRVIRMSEQEVILAAEKPVEQKYFRTPQEIVVV